jgi:hypothetical protein
MGDFPMVFLSNISKKLTIYFRKVYISSLKSFVIRVDSKELKKEFYTELPEELRKNLDESMKFYDYYKNEIQQEKQYWNKELEDLMSPSTSKDKNAGYAHKAVQEVMKEPVKRQIQVYDKIIKSMDSNKTLYLVQFDEELTTKEANHELSKIGLKPAGMLEMVLFFQKYKDTINRYLPIITLEAYFDVDKKIGLTKNALYAVGLKNSDDVKSAFFRIGEIEKEEFYNGMEIKKGVYFLVKPI